VGEGAGGEGLVIAFRAAMRSRTLRFLVCLAVLLPSAVAAAEGSDRGDRVDTFADALFSTHTFSQVALAPNGALVAWVESIHDAAGQPTGKTAIYVADPRAPQGRRRITAKAGTDAGDADEASSPGRRTPAGSRFVPTPRARTSRNCTWPTWPTPPRLRASSPI